MTSTPTNHGLVIDAPAKINVTLDVLGKRADGYHELRSVMQTLALQDTLTLCQASELSLVCDTPSLSADDNLVLRAARLLRDETGYTGGAVLTLEKRIPIEAGLAGGSSDAAAVLMGLNELWELGLSTDQLADLGARLGSDIPFFFYGPTALVSGRGERVERLAQAPTAHVVLVKPAIGVSTARVFARLDRHGGDEATTRLLAAMERGDRPSLWPVANGLQTTVTSVYPEVARALDRLREAGAARPVMTGSGSAVYALFDDEESARKAARLCADEGTTMLTRFGDGTVPARRTQ